MCRRIEHEFDSRPESVPAARHLVARTLEDWGVDDHDVASGAGVDMLLVASELATNAAKAESDRFVLTLDAHHDHVELCIADHDPSPARRLDPGLDQANGRGLGIVAALCTQWGQTPFDGNSKKVWCRIDLAPGSVLGRDCRL